MNQEMWICNECGTEATAADPRLLTSIGWLEDPAGQRGDEAVRLCPVCAKKESA